LSTHRGVDRRGGDGQPDEEDDEEAVEASEDEESRRRRSEAASLQNSIQRGAWTASRLRRVHDDVLAPAEKGEASGEETTWSMGWNGVSRVKKWSRSRPQQSTRSSVTKKTGLPARQGRQGR
jgi:hypothetical protein